MKQTERPINSSVQVPARCILIAVFTMYAAALFYALFIRNPYDLNLPYWQMIKENYSIVPFHMIRDQLYYALRSNNAYLVRYGIKNLAGNLLLFMPMGTLLPCIFKKLRRAYITLPLIACMVICAELIQLFTLRGFADIDDLILNTIGAAVGYFLFYIIRYGCGDVE